MFIQTPGFPHAPLHLVTVNGFLKVSLGAGKNQLSCRWRLAPCYFFTYSFAGLIPANGQVNNFERVMGKRSTFCKKRINKLFTIQPFRFGEGMLHVARAASGINKISAPGALVHIKKRVEAIIQASTIISCFHARQKQSASYGLWLFFWPVLLYH